MTEALILDLGNVLALHDNERLFAQMAEVFHTTREAMRERLDAGLWDRVNRGLLPGDALRQELVARLGSEVSPSAWFELWNCHFTLNEPMVQLVESFVGRIRLVLLSNTHDQHIAYLRPRLPVLERFDGLVLSYEVGVVKPEALIYERALALAGVPAARAAFFDDVPKYVAAAASLGVEARVFTSVAQFRSDLAGLGLADLVGLI